MSEPTITLHEHPAPDDERVVLDGLLAYNVGFIGDQGYTPLGVFARDAHGAVLGGLLGHVRWRWLYVAKLWLPESVRGTGCGGRLMREAEGYARRRGCLGIYLDTFEYHGTLPFYRRHGFEVFGVLEGYPPGYRQYFLRKALVGAAGDA